MDAGGGGWRRGSVQTGTSLILHHLQGGKSTNTAPPSHTPGADSERKAAVGFTRTQTKGLEPATMEENMDESQSQKGCKECCERCVGSLPWASLIATILLYMGVALFCGCGHEALSGTVNILQSYFDVVPAAGDSVDVFTIINILKYIIYGLAAGFFVFGVLLLVEGFFTTGAIRDLYGEFKITACGRCLTAFLMFLAYLFFLVWLGVTAFTSLPVFMYFNVWSMCQNTSLVDKANLCLDLRQFGAVTISEDRKLCTASERFVKMCESNELDLTFHLFVCALAGAGGRSHRHGPLPDGSGRQLGLPEGRQPAAEVRGHQVQRGAGAA
uniref:Neuronal membrane glycoprotein M6-a n=1 Tax=Oryzias latipes TaxID=8090 RepID=A0A3P9JUB8_ORYLA